MRRVLVVLTLCAASLSLPAQTGDAPFGWLLRGSNPQNYHAGVEANTAFLASNSNLENTGIFGTLLQTVSAQNYAGKRVRFHASVRSENVTGWAGLWFRADKGKGTVAFENMEKRPIKGNTEWKNYDIVLDIPADTTSLYYGALVAGSGKIWIDHVVLEPIGSQVSTPGI